MNFDNKQIEDFKKVIEDIVDAQIKKHRITTYVSAIVTAVYTVDKNTVDVVIPPDTSRTITGLQNKTGEALQVGDSVEICTKNGTLSNAWVAVKHGTSSFSGGGGGNYLLDDLPIGAQFAYSSVTNIPEGCLVCDGSDVSRTDYSELFAVIGTTYGEGDGSTTFNLPDKRGRVSVGLDATQTEFNTLGKHIGDKTHTLTINEIPKHQHNLPYYKSTWTDKVEIKTNNAQYGVYGDTSIRYAKDNNEGTYTGGGQSHNNIQPSEVDIWLIKAKQKATNVLPDAIIYNGLDSTSVTDALSANMGNVLNDKIENNTTELDALNDKLNQNIGYQIGDIVITSTNENPSSRLGGTWELVDKEFTNVATSSVGFEPSNNVKNATASFTRSGHTIILNLAFATNVELSDSSILLGTIDFEELGITRFGFNTRETGFCDAGNSVLMIYVSGATGEMSCVDVVGANTVAKNVSCFVTIPFQFVYTYMLDEKCNKFYWKKTA